MPRPIPPLPPVTIATLPLRSNSFAVMSIPHCCSAGRRFRQAHQVRHGRT
jgi:hypothetical protein